MPIINQSESQLLIIWHSCSGLDVQIWALCMPIENLGWLGLQSAIEIFWSFASPFSFNIHIELFFQVWNQLLFPTFYSK